MAASKSAMVSVRVGPHVKAALQAEALQQSRSVANMVEVMILAYCRNQGHVRPPALHMAGTGPQGTRGA